MCVTVAAINKRVSVSMTWGDRPRNAGQTEIFLCVFILNRSHATGSAIHRISKTNGIFGKHKSPLSLIASGFGCLQIRWLLHAPDYHCCRSQMILSSPSSPAHNYAADSIKDGSIGGHNNLISNLIAWFLGSGRPLYDLLIARANYEIL